MKNGRQAILDLGCKTGVLTVQLADLCNKIIGVDNSQSMIDKAKEQFGNIEFMVCNALAFLLKMNLMLFFQTQYFTGLVTMMFFVEKHT